MRTMRRTMHARTLPLLSAALALALLAALLLAASAPGAGHQGRAAAKPGKPAAKAPTGTITSAKPTFKWGKARGAASYELRVYKGKQLLLKKSGLKKTSWTPATALPAGVDLTWKVRARNAAGAGAWSRSLKFRTTDPAIGQAYGGGVVAYILQSGDPGYVAGQTHGLIAAAADQTGAGAHDGIQWAREPYWGIEVPGATGLVLGDGAANTNAIIAQNGAGTDYAAGLARAYTGGGYGDWYLPSKYEFNKLYLNRVAIGGFHTSYPAEFVWYWSSSQVEGFAWYAWYHPMLVGPSGDNGKATTLRVRAVRAF